MGMQRGNPAVERALKMGYLLLVIDGWLVGCARQTVGFIGSEEERHGVL